MARKIRHVAGRIATILKQRLETLSSLATNQNRSNFYRLFETRTGGGRRKRSNFPLSPSLYIHHTGQKTSARQDSINARCLYNKRFAKQERSM